VGPSDLFSDARQQAILSFAKTGNNNLTEASKDKVVLDYVALLGRGSAPHNGKTGDALEVAEIPVNT
jgi:hypothetical protein